MPQLFTNNARASLVSGVTETDTTLTIEAGKADLFPSANVGTGAVPSASNWFKVVLQDSLGDFEIVYVRTRSTGSGIVSNVMRGQEGTTARAFSSGTVVGLRITAADFQSALSSVTSTITTDRLAAEAVTAEKIATNAATSDKILNSAVTLQKLASGLLSFPNFPDRPTALSAFSNDLGYASPAAMMTTIANTAVGAIGSYAFLVCSEFCSPGSVHSYPKLAYAGCQYRYQGSLVTSPVVAGSWRCLGGSVVYYPTLFVRIS